MSLVFKAEGLRPSEVQGHGLRLHGWEGHPLSLWGHPGVSGVHVSTEGHEEGCHQALPTWWWCGGGRVGSCSLLPEARSGVQELCVLEAGQVTAQTLAPSSPSLSPQPILAQGQLP